MKCLPSPPKKKGIDIGPEYNIEYTHNTRSGHQVDRFVKPILNGGRGVFTSVITMNQLGGIV